MARRLSRRDDENPWLRWYPKDYLSDVQLAGSSLAAQGLWARMLNQMYLTSPRGVLPGALEFVSSAVGRSVQEVAPLLAELERNGVLSRGCDVLDDLPEWTPKPAADAIINRRMYGDFLGSSAKSRAGQASGRARRVQRTNAEQTPNECEQTANRKTAENPLNQHDLHKHAPNKRRTKREQPSGISHMSYPEDRIKKDEDPERAREAVSVASVLGRNFGGLRSQELLSRIQAVSGDGAEWSAWWAEAVAALESSERTVLVDIEDCLVYVEACADPAIREAKGLGELKAPGRYLVLKTLEIARQHEIRVPVLPTDRQRATVK